MKIGTYFFLIIILFPLVSMANVVVQTTLPNLGGQFNVKVTSEKAEEVIMTIPHCIGGLGIEVEDGHQYDMVVNSDCTYETLVHTLSSKR